MKRILITLLLAFSILLGYTQNFEGKIVYQNTYKSKMANMTDAQWNDMLGTKQEYFIKDGEYKSVMNGSLAQWQVYVNKNNKLYSKLANSDIVYWNDGSENKDDILEATLNKGVVEILGTKCDELIFKCKSSVQKYYFSSKYKIDPALFVNHKFGNWYTYLSRSGALPLKQIVDNEQFTLESVATEVLPMPVEKTTFILPAAVKTAKSPY